MKRSHLVVSLFCVLSGCAALPGEPVPQGTPEAPAATPSPSASTSLGAALEERHRARARTHASEGNLADALVHWELLVLLRPNNRDYRDAVTETRTNIARQAAHLMQLAELARKQGDLDQAELWYLRVLNLDRANAVAAQALRDMEADRTKRAYSNRPPRIRM